MDDKINLVLAGLGGQGVITTSIILGKAAVSANLNVYSSEIHGIAQRGFPVICTVRMGNVYGPLIATGAADAIVCTEPLEVLRYIKYANKKTKIITDITPVVPYKVTIGLENYPDLEKVFKEIRSYAKLYIIDSIKLLKNNGASLISKNIVMLGALAAIDVLPFTSYVLLESILDTFSQKNKEMNKKIFLEGLKVFHQ